MKERLGEELTIDDMARSAMFSKFHFSRMFHQATGVSPGRFLSAMRLAEAKRLLLATSITVTDISHRVGYNSVGTFSTRFSSRVGVSPSTYRRLGGVAPVVPVDEVDVPVTVRGTDVRGHIIAPENTSIGLVFVGLFRGRITEGPPVRSAVLDGPDSFVLRNVPEGSWYLVAHCPDGAPYVGHLGPITTRPGTVARMVDLRLRPTRPFDPPVLLALPDLRAGFSPAHEPVAIAA